MLIRAFDKYYGPCFRNCAAHSFQHLPLSTLNIDFDKRRFGEVTHITRSSITTVFDDKPYGCRTVAMPNQTCRGRVLINTDDRFSTPVRGCNRQELNICKFIIFNVSPKQLHISRNRLERDYPTSHPNQFCK
jgi:hypothetical protein